MIPHLQRQVRVLRHSGNFMTNVVGVVEAPSRHYGTLIDKPRQRDEDSARLTLEISPPSCTEARMRLSLFVFCVVLLTSSASSQVTSEAMGRCAAISIPALRLQCYDSLARPRADTATTSHGIVAPGTKMIQNWV